MSLQLIDIHLSANIPLLHNSDLNVH
ncbi:hypothetical protein F383_30963 [Gossypium arboreum]|uniref:Uncharacterized protein n=1 Tax=Gossypium arboreum TaxID=29729 RepID=A0A0B0PJH8_GOSAR|nr:hypothetical protein F383_30963 [Gossypium arboreum]